jgi:hypothetical protein
VTTDLEQRVREIAREVAREEIQRSLAQNGHAPWMSVEEVADFLKTTPAAIHTRSSSTGWLREDSIKEGRRRFFRREAVLAELERKAAR